jgi:thioredoxin 1
MFVKGRWIVNAVLPVSLANFTSEVMNAKEPVLVDFWAAYCAPCRNLKPVLAEVAKSVKVVTVDITEEEELTKHFGVESIPTLVVFKDGKPGNRVVGIQSADKLLELVKAA